MNVANEIEYVTTDPKRQVIPYVRLKDRKGNVREYIADGVTQDQIAKGERRRMDCMDCHNRPSHPFATSADRAVNQALADGSIPKNLPFVRREAAAALKASYPDQQSASDGIAGRLREFYRTQVPKAYMERRQDVERTVSATDALYRRNVFPKMRVGWGTYPNNIGHMDFPGCFRCHDESHKTKDGQSIRQECDLCHTVE
jgi:hypothetical protein